MKLTVLGSGSPLATSERCSSGYLLQLERETIMMDCGPGTGRRLLEAGHKVTDIHKVVLTHLHFDHCLDLPWLAVSRWDAGGPQMPPLQIWGPKGIREFVEAALAPNGMLHQDLVARTQHPDSLALFHARGGQGARPWPEFEITEIGEGSVVNGDGWVLRCAEVPHVEPYLRCYGLRWEIGDKVLAYPADISKDIAGTDRDRLIALVRDADLLVQYMNDPFSQLSAYDVPGGASAFHQKIADIARAGNVDTMIAVHMGPSQNADGVKERIIQNICNHFPGRFIWGRDLLTVTF